MTFTEFLKSKLNLIIVFTAINSFALFVNIFGIKGNVREEDNYYKTFSKRIDLFTQGYDDESTSKFWPFVDFKSSWSKWDDISSYDKGPDKSSIKFYGLFNQYDYSEFLAYSLILLLIFYFNWNRNKSGIKRVKKSKIMNAFANTLIEKLKEKGVITNGLTIPYLVGALNVRFNFPSNKSTLIQLVDNLINSTIDNNKLVLMFCGDIDEYVISVESEKFCEENYSNEISFRNAANIKTLYITDNAKNFGKTKEELVENLWIKYVDQIQNKLYSWKSLEHKYFSFDDIEIRRIWEVI